MSYVAPVEDLLFCMRLAGLDEVAAVPGFEEATPDTARAVLDECARFCAEVLAPLNREGDLHPAVCKDGQVTTSPGFKAAFTRFSQGGWQGLPHPPEFGGQGLPRLVAAACTEMLNSANLSFALCPLLTDGAIEALLTSGSGQQKAFYLPRMIDGRWTGTMNLTESQAGSDLSLVSTRAVPHADGSHRLFGQKIFITYGDHDLAENIIHFVLARIPGAPEGVKGISLFLVPKFLVLPDGAPGRRNDVVCASLEHKLGIRGSPTAVLIYGGSDAPEGEAAGAAGYLVGQENHGLEAMFIMMNAARFAVGVQGVAIAERARQQAVAYARERLQSRPPDGSSKQAAPIIRQPDVRRMLMTMRALVEGGRAMAATAAAACDLGHRHPDGAARAAQQALYEFLVPVVKGWCTEVAIEVASLNIQVHGGTGFIEETGAAQHYRDARILAIYEGTTAIQANDLVGRKTLRDAGAVVRTVCAAIERTEAELALCTEDDAARIGLRLFEARASLLRCVDFMLTTAPSDPNRAYAGSVPYLMLAGHVVAGWQMARAWLLARQAMETGSSGVAFMKAKAATALFHAEHVLVRSIPLREVILFGGDAVMRLDEQAF